MGEGDSKQTTGIVLGSLGAGLGAGLSTAGGLLLGGAGSPTATAPASMLANPLVIGGIAAAGIGGLYLLTRK